MDLRLKLNGTGCHLAPEPCDRLLAVAKDAQMRSERWSSTSANEVHRCTTKR